MHKPPRGGAGFGRLCVWYVGFQFKIGGIMAIHFFIPVDGWSGFKNSVMAAWFHDSEPALTRHCGFDIDGFEFASFASSYPEDVDHVVSLFPAGSVIIPA